MVEMYLFFLKHPEERLFKTASVIKAAYRLVFFLKILGHIFIYLGIPAPAGGLD